MHEPGTRLSQVQLLPVSFFNTHKDWILECNAGFVKILPASMKKTLSEANQVRLKHEIWVGTDDENLCRRCEKIRKSTGSGFCGKCKLVFYCSKDCQVKDWKRHKEECVKA